GVVAETAHHVAVMYAGRVVEYAKVQDLFDAPRHPYTKGLLRSLPDMVAPGERLTTIPGIVPSAERFPSGCRFRTRCPLAAERCSAEVPPLEPVPGSTEHLAACFFLEEAREL
ncbi:MAG: dipeptide ABC transporter ATP-binding protein DppD, partial [Planctomycetota bacterium]